MTDRYIFQIQKLAREWADLATSLHIQKNEAIYHSICYLISVRRFPNGNRSWSARGLGERVYVSVRLLFSPLCPAEWPQCFNRWSGVIQWCHHGIFACYIKDDLMMLPGSTWLVFAVCVYASYYIFFQTAFLRLDRAERVLMTATVLFPKRVCPASCYVLRLCGNAAHVFGLRRSHGNCKQLVTSQWWIIPWVKSKLPLGRGS